MANKRNTRSSTRHSQAQSRSAERPVSGPPLNDVHRPATEGISFAPLDRVQRMEEAQNEILQLLREARHPFSARGASPLQNIAIGDPPVIPPLRSEVHRPENELGGTIRHPTHQNDTTQPREIRDEIRRLIQEEFPGRNLFTTHRRSQERSPLAEGVRQHPIPPKFKIPSIDSYDGTSDPYEHVDYYRTIMHIQQAPDALLCHVFPTTLKGQARTWFYSLPTESINNFEELTAVFTEQFIASRRIVKDSSHLSGIRQNEGETLKEYFQRFSVEARQIPGVDQELLRGVFLGGLRPGPFYSSLMRDTVRSYADLVHRVEAQIAADEAINAHKQQFGQSSGKRKNGPEDANQNSQKKKFNSRESRDFIPPPVRQHRDSHHEKSYTPLNTSRTNILMAIEDREALKWPKPLRNSNGGDQSQYCRFHRTKGHSTEKCFHLKEEIERLIRQGRLGLYLQEQGEGNQKEMIGVID